MALRVCIVIYFILILKTKTVYCTSEYVDKYEVVDFKFIDHNSKYKRSLFVSKPLNGPEFQTDLEIQFTSFRKHFHLLLSEDVSFQNTPVQLLSDNRIERTNVKARFYEGILKNDSNSSILGYMLDGLFTGRINDWDLTYFVEPASLFFSDVRFESQKLVVYRENDVRLFEWKIAHKNPWKISEIYFNVSINIAVQNSALDISNGTEHFTCDVEMVADHTLYNLFDNHTDRLSAVLYFHAKYADYVFRRTDFNMDGIPDRTRISVGRIFIYKSTSDKNYPMQAVPNLSEYLVQFALRQQQPRFCLSIAMTYMRNADSIIGEAFKAEYRFTETLGGICDAEVPIDDISLSFNTGVINVWGPKGKPLPLAITTLAFTHEMGHGFGSSHDSIMNPICSPGKIIGNYLMYPVSTYGSPNSMKFSPCSRESIFRILRLKGGCLQYKKPVCGNGIREGDEECDCGSELFCNLIDSCCTPSDVIAHETGCTFRSKRGYQCSPKESRCCNMSCQIVEDPDKICYSDEYRCLYSFCDGKTAICPKPKKAPDSLCVSKLSCDETSCNNNTICLDKGLQACYCKDLANQCFQCCMKDNNCTPASELGIMNPAGKPYILQPDTSCNYGLYRCDDLGRCTRNYISDGSLLLYICFMVVPFLISILIIIAILISCQQGRANRVAIVRNDS